MFKLLFITKGENVKMVTTEFDDELLPENYDEVTEQNAYDLFEERAYEDYLERKSGVY